jgi:hypothetical protein
MSKNSLQNRFEAFQNINSQLIVIPKRSHGFMSNFQSGGLHEAIQASQVKSEMLEHEIKPNQTKN